jgi:CMP-N-acetylneuraminic acid synthetase
MIEMKAVCLIPARGGSKRFPRKNIVDFLGRPIISYTIEAALGSGIFERVVVSTDNDEIKNVAQSFGATVIQRPAHLANDTARLTEVCMDFIQSEEALGRTYDIFMCLLATSPMRSTEDLRSVFKLVSSERCDFSMAVTSYDLPPFQALRKKEDGSLEAMWPELVNLRSQEAPELVVDNGSTYCAKISAFKQHSTFYGPGLRGYWMPRDRSIDLDEPVDLELALYFAKRKLP